MAKNGTQSADVPEPVFDRGPSGVGETTWQNTDKGTPFVDPTEDYGVNDGAWSIYDENNGGK
jgi:hypothetical protein